MQILSVDAAHGSIEDNLFLIHWTDACSVGGRTIAGEGHDRCCNCGLELDPRGHLHLVRNRLFAIFGTCSEGCSIQIWVRGKCATNSRHPWRLYKDEEWLPDYPEVAEIRARILAGSR